MRTYYRDVALLACCQALLLINNAALIAMNGLVGYALAENKAFATVGVTTYVLGSALAAMPASLWMAKVGRRRGFMTGSLVAIVGSTICALALASSSFALFCLGTGVLGIYTAFGFHYRFAAAEVATQGLNDVIIFAVMGVSSFASGVLVNAAGWETMNAGALPFIAAVAIAAAWFALARRRGARQPASP